MEKIKQFFSKKLNLFAVLVIAVAAIAGGYEAYTNANGDFACNVTEIHMTKNKTTLKDQVSTGCSDIVWGEWKKISDKKEERDGVGVKTVIDYRKVKISNKEKSRWSGIYGETWGGFYRYNISPEECKDWGGKVYGIGSYSFCAKKTNKGRKSCGTHTYIDSNTHSSKVDRSLRNDSSAKVYRTNQICRVKQTRHISNSCTEKWKPAVSDVCNGTWFNQTRCNQTKSVQGTKNCKPICTVKNNSWTPAVSDVCQGTGFTQTNNCGGTREATGTKTGPECDKCTDKKWTPAINTKCIGVYFTQTSNCDNTRDVKGTKICNPYCSKHPTSKKCNPDYCSTHPTVKECNSDPNYCINHPKAKECNDDMTKPVDDDPTNCIDKDNDGLCDTGVDDGSDTQGPIDVKLAWSTDKIHWNDDFDKLILLKTKKDKIYIKDTPTSGTCKKQSGSWLDLFKVFMPKAAGKANPWLNQGTPEDNGSSFLLPLQPNEHTKSGEAFEQKVNINFCDDASEEEKPLHVKVVDIKQEEI